MVAIGFNGFCGFGIADKRDFHKGCLVSLGCSISAFLTIKIKIASRPFNTRTDLL